MILPYKSKDCKFKESNRGIDNDLILSRL